MSEIAEILVPFFALILIGFGVGRLGFVKAGGVSALSFFVFYLAMPALFLQLVAATPLSEFEGFSFLLATTFATYCAFAIAFSVGALLNGGNISEATVQGLLGSYSNSSYMAPALTVAAFGTAAAMPTALIFSFDTILVLIVTPLMMALGGSVRADPRRVAEGIARQVLMHPLILATVVGLLMSAFRITLPEPVDLTLSALREAAVPGALFLLGLGLSQRSLDRIPVELPILTAIKLIVHPLIVYLLLSWVGGFDGTWVYVAVAMAALPPAAQVQGIAQHYKVYGQYASAGIALAMIASISTITLVLILLLNGILPVQPFR